MLGLLCIQFSYKLVTDFVISRLTIVIAVKTLKDILQNDVVCAKIALRYMRTFSHTWQVSQSPYTLTYEMHKSLAKKHSFSN